MAVMESTGFVEAILGPRSFDQIFRDGVIQIWSGSQPTSADEAPVGTLLGLVTADGVDWSAGAASGGLRFSRTGRYVVKDPAQLWQFKGIASGTAGWFRLLPNSVDPATRSMAAPRIDGAVGAADAAGDAQIKLPSINITPGLTIDISSWWYAFPPL